MNKKNGYKTSVIYIFVIILLSVSLLLIYYLRSLIFLIFLSFIIAYLFNPLIKSLQKLKINRNFAILIFLIFLILIGSSISVFLIKFLQKEVDILQTNLPDYLTIMREKVIPKIEMTLKIEISAPLEKFINEGFISIKRLPPDIVDYIKYFFTKTFSGIISFLLGLLNLLIIPLFVFYFLKDMDSIYERIYLLIPLNYREKVKEKAREVDNVFGSYIRGQAIICTILAIFYSIGLSILGIDLAILIGILTGIFNFVPYLGLIFGIFFSSLMALLKYQTLFSLFNVLILFIIIQLLESFIITPRILGTKLGLHPLIVLISIIAGGKLFGFWGLIFSIPAVAGFNILLKTLIEIYINSDFYKGNI